MAYALSPSSLEWQRKAREYAEKELIPFEEVAEFNEGLVPPDVATRHKARAIELGFSRMDAPAEHGGLALPKLDQVLVWEQLGRVTNALCWSMSEAHEWMFEACTRDQIERFIKPLMSGQRCECYAITEAQAGSDPDAIATTARLDGGDYVINGEKWFVTSANKADFMFLQAVAIDASGGRQHALFLVELSTPGIDMIDSPLFGHTFASHHPTYRFKEVRIPAANRIGAAGDTAVKLNIYETIARTTQAPTSSEVAEALSVPPEEVAAALERLHKKRLLVPEPGDPSRIRMAPPFSGVETSFRVHVQDKVYYANCAWDALGIVAALHADAVIEASDGYSGDPMTLEVRNGQPVPQPCVIHFAVPAAHWWDDIIYT